MGEGVFPAGGVSIGARVRRFTLAVPRMLSSPPFCILLLGVIPLLLTVPAIVHAVTGERNLSDFLSFWNAGRRVIHGESPYPSIGSLPAVADPSTFAPFVYPAPAAFAVVPFAVLPFAVAASLWLAVSMGSIALALRLLDVRDWRCYGAVLASVPVFAS